jgi:hypothetical protein
VALVGGGAVLAFGGGAADQEETTQGSPPRIEIATPARDGRYAPGSDVRASFRCLEATTSQVIRGAGCRGTRAPNARIDTAPGRHTFQVTATGDHGLTKSVRIAYVATSENRDRRRPTITVTAPQSGRYTPGQRVIAAYSCDDHGGSGIAECRGTRPNGRRVSTRIGRHRFMVRAVDRDGNTALRQLLYYVPDPDHPDTQDPTVAITSPAATQYDEGAAITARYTCTDDHGTPSCSATIAASSGDTIPVRDDDTLPNAPGTYTLTVTAVDDAGNDAAVSRSYTVTSGPGTSQPACADKKDNDDDTRVDRKDPGCSSAEDNDETDLTIDDCPTSSETRCANEPTTVLALPQDGPLVAPSATPSAESTG